MLQRVFLIFFSLGLFYKNPFRSYLKSVKIQIIYRCLFNYFLNLITTFR